jgi:predicted nicotinamide N-methyase
MIPLIEYRLKRERVRIGGSERIELEIEALDDLNRTIDELFLELERTGNSALLEELCPYFGTIWPSALALSETLAANTAAIRGRTVLELGCGLAIPSLVAARAGARVTATDFHPEVPRFLERNLRNNKIPNQGFGGVSYVALDWRRTGAENAAAGLGIHDWVIGSDVLYERQHAIELAGAIASVVSPGGRAVIADPARPYLQAFVDEMVRRGFRYETLVRTVDDRPVPKDVFIVTLERVTPDRGSVERTS